MADQTVVYLHGFASSAQGTKARYFRRQFKALSGVEFHAIDFNPTDKDFEYLTTTGMINRFRQYVLDRHLGNLLLIGSSYGGLIALHYAHRFGGVEGMILLAPGLVWLSGGLPGADLERWERAGALPVFHDAFQKEIPVRYELQVDGLRYLEPVPPAAPTMIIHGESDSIVPIDHSRTYAASFPDRVHLIEVEAGHNLNGHLEFIWEHVQSFLLQGAAPIAKPK